MQDERLTKTEALVGTVLVVDDDEGVRNVLSRWVENLGHQVVVASGGDEAMVLMGEHPVNVVLCDVRMPGRDGFWVVDQLRQKYPGTGIVLVTGLGELDPSVILRPGIVGCIGKPFNRQELTDVLRRAFAACRTWAAAASPAPAATVTGRAVRS